MDDHQLTASSVVHVVESYQSVVVVVVVWHSGIVSTLTCLQLKVESALDDAVHILELIDRLVSCTSAY